MKSAAEIGFIFDWDGVVVDSSKQHEESWELLAKQENQVLPTGHFKKGFGKKNEWIMRNVLQWTDQTAEISRLGEEKERLYRDIVRKTGLDPLPGVKQFIEEFQSQGYRAAVGSSTPKANILAVLEITGLNGLLADIVAAEDVEIGKPNPAVFIKAAKLVGLPPEKCVVFEDSLGGIEAGLASGAKVVGVTTTNPEEILRDAGVGLVVDSFEEISVERMLALFE
ncbi:HAD family phosphatase [Puniceicoccaceae bacterium K14]|nr:HAD family phosphatase [Puniceicoccaceae bacterium K14]